MVSGRGKIIETIIGSMLFSYIIDAYRMFFGSKG